MYLRCNERFKDGKQHRYWNIVENKRVAGGRIVQRQVLYLGEINDHQQKVWRKTIEVFEDGKTESRQISLFPEDRPLPADECNAIHVRLNELKIKNPRQWGACWLFCELWEQLQLDNFWRDKLLPSRRGTRWLNVFKTLVAYRLIDPGSEWRLHRLWYEQSAMSDLLSEDFGLAQKDKLYRCLDKLIEYKNDLFGFLQKRWQDMFNVRFDILLYDLTSTYFECDPPEQGMRKFGYSRDKRSDCVQVVIALIITPDGFPLAYEVMPGNTKDSNTFTFSLRKDKLRGVRKREGKYLLRSNLTSHDPAMLWKQYIQLTEIEQAFRNLKGEMNLRPIHHRIEERIEAHIFVAFQAYCLHVTLRQRLKALAPGLTAGAVLDKFKQIQMVDVEMPTSDGRTLKMARYTHPEKDHKIILSQLKLELPKQSPPRITSGGRLID